MLNDIAFDLGAGSNIGGGTTIEIETKPAERFWADLGQLECAYDISNATVWSHMHFRDRPSFNPDLLVDFHGWGRNIRTLKSRMSDNFKYVVLASRHPSVFCLGGDLDCFSRYIRNGDRAALAAYGRSCIQILHDNWSVSQTGVISIALVQGDALGGGFESLLSFDVLVAERGTKFGFPEQLFGLFPGMCALTFLGRKLGFAKAEQLVRTGKILTAEELYEMGVLTAEQIGFDAKFGSAQALVKFAEMTARGEGFGKEIGLGSKRLTEKYGHPDLSMSVKGQEFPAYDSRGIQGMGLTYATSNRGACHLRSYTVASEVLGIPVKTDPLTADGKPELVKAFQDATAAFDAAGICIFTSFAWTLADVQPQVAAACGPEFTMAKMDEIGERIWNMERDFNNRAGFTSKDDTLPKRLLTEPAQTGPAKGLVNKLPEMLPKYYEIRGWDADGQLKAETRERLGL